MSESFEIVSAHGNYRITVGGVYLDLSERHGDTYVYLVDQRLEKTVKAAAAHMILIPAVEPSKSLENMASIVTQLRQRGVNRDSHILAVGGGIIQDVATFVASIYMRGIPWTYYPSTLLGMVDSCVGGKSSINVGGYKNLAGNFYPPCEVIIDLAFTRTLNAEQIVSGLCEAAKICFARGPETFGRYLGLVRGPVLSPQCAGEIAELSLKTKKWFIEVDEFDKKERLLLNFGHTFGHALEATTHFAVPHGVAVGIGMLVADNFSRQRRLLGASARLTVDRLSSHIIGLLGAVRSSTAAIGAVDMDDLMRRFDGDKKHSREEYRMILPVEDGRLSLMAIPRVAASHSDITGAFQHVFSKLLR